jgi:hypothetical protein
MSPETIRPGDRVIELAPLARTAGFASGLFAGILVTALAAGGPGLAMAFGGAGAVCGGIVGHILGRLRYRQGGSRLVVKRGPSSLQIALTAALSTSLPAAIVVWLGCLTVLGGPAPSLLTGAACLVSGVLTGVALALAASRL